MLVLSKRGVHVFLCKCSEMSELTILLRCEGRTLVCRVWAVKCAFPHPRHSGMPAPSLVWAARGGIVQPFACWVHPNPNLECNGKRRTAPRRLDDGSPAPSLCPFFMG